MPSLYDEGEGFWIRAAFTDPATGLPQDPVEVRVSYLPPSASTPTEKVYGTDVEVIREGAGEYAILLTGSEPGLWLYRWEGENTAPAVQEGSVIVRRTAL